VSESAEITESKILQHRKKNKDLNLAQADKLKVDFEKDLAMREKKELEERKKRAESEEESKYDNIHNHSYKRWKSNRSVKNDFTSKSGKKI